MDKNLIRVGVNVILIRSGKILLSKRKDTGWNDGLLCIPGGHSMALESPTQAAVREMQEELGLDLDRLRLKFVCVAARNSTPYEFASYIFKCELEPGEKPVNKEPERCSGVVWVNPKKLPDDTILEFRTMIEEGYLRKIPYLEIFYS